MDATAYSVQRRAKPEYSRMLRPIMDHGHLAAEVDAQLAAVILVDPQLYIPPGQALDLLLDAVYELLVVHGQAPVSQRLALAGRTRNAAPSFCLLAHFRYPANCGSERRRSTELSSLARVFSENIAWS